MIGFYINAVKHFLGLANSGKKNSPVIQTQLKMFRKENRKFDAKQHFHCFTFHFSSLHYFFAKAFLWDLFLTLSCQLNISYWVKNGMGTEIVFASWLFTLYYIIIVQIESMEKNSNHSEWSTKNWFETFLWS